MARQVGARWQANAYVDGSRKRVMFDTKEEAEAYEANPLAERLKPTVGEVFRHGYRFMWDRTRNARDTQYTTSSLSLTMWSAS